MGSESDGMGSGCYRVDGMAAATTAGWKRAQPLLAARFFLIVTAVSYYKSAVIIIFTTCLKPVVIKLIITIHFHRLRKKTGGESTFRPSYDELYVVVIS